MGLGYNGIVYYDCLAQQKDLEFQRTKIAQRRTYLINVTASINGSLAKLDPSSEGYKALDIRVQQINQVTQYMDFESSRIDMKLQAVNNLMQGTKTSLDQNIKDSFTLSGS